MKSTRASVRALLAYALEHPSEEGAVQTITRTLKLKVAAPRGSDLQHALNAQFTAFDTVRRQALAELEEFWTKKPDDLTA
jgi:hypothetical protein